MSLEEMENVLQFANHILLVEEYDKEDLEAYFPEFIWEVDSIGNFLPRKKQSAQE